MTCSTTCSYGQWSPLPCTNLSVAISWRDIIGTRVQRQPLESSMLSVRKENKKCFPVQISQKLLQKQNVCTIENELKNNN
jgi:hypothetical protein